MMSGFFIFAEVPAAVKVMVPLAAGSAMTSASADTGVEMWLRSLAFLLGIAVALKHLLGKKSSAPQPFKVEQLKEMATHEDLKILENHVESKFENQRAVARDSLGKVHTRIDQVAKSTASTEAKLDEVKENTNRILNKLL